jgi:hypothetical protein
MIFKRNYEGKCWWCGSNANSGEHKIKKTDFTSVYGNGPYTDKELRPLLMKNGKQIPIQGPNSQYIKFAHCLCHVCNTDKSSDIDKAYTTFIDFVMKNFEKIVLERGVNTIDIFGTDWREGKNNVLRYYLKHIGCQVATGDYEVSENIKEFMNGGNILNDINFMFQIRTYNYLLSELLKMEGSNFETLYLGYVRFFSRHDYPKNAVESLTGWYTKNWFSVNYLYEVGIRERLYGLDYSNSGSPFLNFEIVGIDDYPMMSHLIENGNNQKIFEKMENFDRGETIEEAIAFCNKLKKYKVSVDN